MPGDKSRTFRPERGDRLSQPTSRDSTRQSHGDTPEERAQYYSPFQPLPDASTQQTDASDPRMQTLKYQARYKRALDLYLGIIKSVLHREDVEAAYNNWKIAWKIAGYDPVAARCEELMQQGLTLDQANEQACEDHSQIRLSYPEVVEEQSSPATDNLSSREIIDPSTSTGQKKETFTENLNKRLYDATGKTRKDLIHEAFKLEHSKYNNIAEYYRKHTKQEYDSLYELLMRKIVQQHLGVSYNEAKYNYSKQQKQPPPTEQQLLQKQNAETDKKGKEKATENEEQQQRELSHRYINIKHFIKGDTRYQIRLANRDDLSIQEKNVPGIHFIYERSQLYIPTEVIYLDAQQYTHTKQIFELIKEINPNTSIKRGEVAYVLGRFREKSNLNLCRDLKVKFIWEGEES